MRRGRSWREGASLQLLINDRSLMTEVLGRLDTGTQRYGPVTHDPFPAPISSTSLHSASARRSGSASINLHGLQEAQSDLRLTVRLREDGRTGLLKDLGLRVLRRLGREVGVADPATGGCCRAAHRSRAGRSGPAVDAQRGSSSLIPMRILPVPAGHSSMCARASRRALSRARRAGPVQSQLLQ